MFVFPTQTQASNPINYKNPIVSSSTFAAAASSYSNTLYIRLTHNRLIAERLPLGVATGTMILAAAKANIHNLNDLEGLLSELVLLYREKQEEDDAMHGPPPPPPSSPQPQQPEREGEGAEKDEQTKRKGEEEEAGDETDTTATGSFAGRQRRRQRAHSDMCVCEENGLKKANRTPTTTTATTTTAKAGTTAEGAREDSTGIDHHHHHHHAHKRIQRAASVSFARPDTFFTSHIAPNADFYHISRLIYDSFMDTGTVGAAAAAPSGAVGGRATASRTGSSPYQHRHLYEGQHHTREGSPTGATGEDSTNGNETISHSSDEEGDRSGSESASSTSSPSPPLPPPHTLSSAYCSPLNASHIQCFSRSIRHGTSFLQRAFGSGLPPPPPFTGTHPRDAARSKHNEERKRSTTANTQPRRAPPGDTMADEKSSSSSSSTSMDDAVKVLQLHALSDNEGDVDRPPTIAAPNGNANHVNHTDKAQQKVQEEGEEDEEEDAYPLMERPHTMIKESRETTKQREGAEEQSSSAAAATSFFGGDDGSTEATLDKSGATASPSTTFNDTARGEGANNLLSPTGPSHDGDGSPFTPPPPPPTTAAAAAAGKGDESTLPPNSSTTLPEQLGAQGKPMPRKKPSLAIVTTTAAEEEEAHHAAKTAAVKDANFMNRLFSPLFGTSFSSSTDVRLAPSHTSQAKGQSGRDGGDREGCRQTRGPHRHHRHRRPSTSAVLAPAPPDADDDDDRELAGWLHLLVWERQLICFLLRELSELQGTISWCALYWSWAQGHPWEAGLHQALSSWRFWRGVWQKGHALQVVQNRYTAVNRLRKLKSLFKLIVSSIGAAHTALSRLNACVEMLHQQCELVTSQEAAMAAALAKDAAPPPPPPPPPPVTPPGTPIATATAAAAATTGRPPRAEDVHPTKELRRVILSTTSVITTIVRARELLEGAAHEDDVALHHAWSEASTRYEHGYQSNFLGPGDVLDALHTDAAMSLGRSTSVRAAATATRLPPLGDAATLEDGVHAMQAAVEGANAFLRQLQDQLQHDYRPPAARHWLRVFLTVSWLGPPFVWLYKKNPAEVLDLGARAARWLTEFTRTYVLLPAQQLWESIFYVRPGVQDRRQAFDRDAKALANIIRDYHEDYYPSMSQAKLDEMHDRSLDAIRRGLGDEEGYGLIARHYRDAVKHPIRSAFFGNLPRLLLIQMSFQSLEVSRVTNGIDEVLEGNDFNFKVMALVPVVMVGWVVVTWVRLRWRFMLKPIYRRMKLYWRALYRLVSFASTEGERMAGSNRSHSGGLPFYYVNNHTSVPPMSAAEGLSQPFGGPNSPALGGGDTPPTTNISVNMNMNINNNNNPGVPPLPFGANAGASFFPSFIAPPPPHTFMRAAPSAGGPAYPTACRDLNNFEKGMLLLLVHAMRSTATTYFGQSYPFYRELMEDLEDLENNQSGPTLRLQTLHRMYITHTFLH